MPRGRHIAGVGGDVVRDRGEPGIPRRPQFRLKAPMRLREIEYRPANRVSHARLVQEAPPVGQFASETPPSVRVKLTGRSSPKELQGDQLRRKSL
jgi:hypothetical protein